MREKALLLLSSAMFATASFSVSAQSNIGQSNIAQSFIGQSNISQSLLNQAVPIGQALTAAPGQQIVIEDFQLIPGAATAQVVQQPAIHTQYLQQQPVQMVHTAPAPVPSVQTQIQTTQPQVTVPQGGSNTFYYYTQPATVYGNPAPAAPTYTPPSRVFPETVPTLPVVTALPKVNADHYMGFRGSFSNPEDYKYTLATNAPATLESENGYALIGRIGKRFAKAQSGSALRAELEAAHREFQAEAIGGQTAHQGKTSSSSAMANLIAELGTGPGAIVKPYIGIGGGAAQLRHADHLISGGTVTLDDRTIAPAAQGMLGVGVSMGHSVDLSLEGRHFHVFEAEREAPNGITSKDDFGVNEIGIGVDFNF